MEKSQAMMDILTNAKETITQLFKVPSENITLAHGVWSNAKQSSSMKVTPEFVINPREWHNLSSNEQLQRLQLMADKTNIAEKASALHLEQLCNLQKRFCSAEVANQRLLSAFSGIEERLMEIFNKLMNEEVKRAASITNLTSENNTLKRKLATVQQTLSSKEGTVHIYEARIFDLQTDVKHMENEATLTKMQLEDALKRETQLQAELKKLQNEVFDVKNSLDIEKNKSSRRSQYLQGEADLRDQLTASKKENEQLKSNLRIEQEALKQLKIEHHYALEKQQRVFDEEIYNLNSHHRAENQGYRRQVDSLKHNIEDLEKSRLRIYRHFVDHLEKLNADKTKITSDLRVRIAQSYKTVIDEFNNYRNSQNDSTLPEDSPVSGTTTTTYMDNLENVPPSHPRRQQQRRHSTQKYHIEGDVQLTKK